MSYELHWTSGALHIKFLEVVTHDDLVGSCADAAADGRSDRIQSSVADFTSVHGYDCTGPDLVMMVLATARLIRLARSERRVYVAAPSGATSIDELVGRCREISSCCIERIDSPEQVRTSRH